MTCWAPSHQFAIYSSWCWLWRKNTRCKAKKFIQFCDSTTQLDLPHQQYVERHWNQRPQTDMFLSALLWVCERMGTGITIPKKNKTQRRANLILVDWKVHQMLDMKIICHNLQNYWNHHIFFWESIALEHWEDKIWGSVWIRIPPLKNNPAMNMKWRNIYVHIYIYVMFWATKLAGTQIFVSNIVGILLGEPRTFLLNPPEKK